MSATADYIRETREKKGLTLKQVEEATRIPRYYLEILEGGGDDRLVSDPLYMVHFLRNYAAFLEVEEDILAAEFVRENRKPEPRGIVPVQERRSWRAIATAALAVLLVLGAGVYLYDSTLLGIRGGPAERIAVRSTDTPPPEAPAPPRSPTPTTPSGTDDGESSVLQPEANETDASTPRLVATAPEPGPAPAPEPGPEPVTAVQNGPPPPTPQDARTPRAEETAAGTSEPGEPPPTVPDSAAGGVPTTHSLTIRAEAKSWLRVWVDGEPFRDMLLEAGQIRTVSAQSGFVITFGNAGGVRLTLNGEELPAVGKSGQVVRGFKLPPEP